MTMEVQPSQDGRIRISLRPVERCIDAIACVRNIWASLPGAGYGQPEHKLSDLLALYRKAGGTVAP